MLTENKEILDNNYQHYVVRSNGIESINIFKSFSAQLNPHTDEEVPLLRDHSLSSD